MSIELDQVIPDFTLPATGEQDVKLTSLRGQKIVLYFYPKDDTPGCTLEGQEFAQLHKQFLKLDALVFGVSRDSIKSHDKFKCKYDYPFDLISDADETLCREFDVIKEKNMYGKKVFGIERSTFVIDAEGVLRKAWRKVKPEGHAQEVLDAIKAL
jgi:thioredoxin-dependent peroxiredoxin